jgi:hypothetical protein
MIIPPRAQTRFPNKFMRFLCLIERFMSSISRSSFSDYLQKLKFFVHKDKNLHAMKAQSICYLKLIFFLTVTI